MGEERSGRERPRPGHRLGRDWVKDETHTASHTDPHRPGEQPPSVRMGTHEWQLDTQQAADSKGTAPEGERSSHSALSPAAHYFRSLREDRNACVCVWGWGPEAGGRGCRGAPGAGPRHPQLAAAPRPCWEPPHPLAGRCFRNFGWGGRWAPCSSPQSWSREETPAPQSQPQRCTSLWLLAAGLGRGVGRLRTCGSPPFSLPPASPAPLAGSLHPNLQGGRGRARARCWSVRQSPG